MNYKANTQTNVKLNNQKIILQLLVNEGAMTRAELAKKMKSSKPTVSKNVEDLISEKMILEVGKDDNLIGKKGTLLDINADYGHVLAIDLSKNYFRVVVSNLKKEWIHEQSVSLENFLNEENALNILTILKTFFEDKKISLKKIRLVSIAYPGVVGHNDSLYLTNLKFRQELLEQLVPYIRFELQKPLMIKNDINLATIAEKRYGMYQDTANLYLLSGDVGVGAGIIINHQLYEGDRNAAGEVGFVLPIQRKDGRYYTLEEKVCLQALEKQYSLKMKAEKSFYDLVQDIDKKVELALELYDEVVEDLSVAITNVASILDIKRVVLDGRLFDLKDTMVEDLNTKVNLMTPFETNVSRTAIHHISLKGAIVLGVESVLADLI